MQMMRESIFLHTIRSFCVSFAGVIGIIIAIMLLLFSFGAFSPTRITVPEKLELIVGQDAEGQRNLLPDTAPVLLCLDFNGVIGQGDLSYHNIETMLVESQQYPLRKGRVKGLLLHMNTPGGYSYDSAAIHDAILRYKQKYNVPVYAYVEDLCASGGIYIACAADKIYASPYSIIGSVGVILSTAFNFTTAMDKLGIQALTLTEGKDKDALNPFRPWKPDEAESIRAIMDALYDQFITAVSTGRPMVTKEKLINQYGAHVFVSPEAKKIGMIDNDSSTYYSALTELAAAAQIPENEKYQVFRFRIPHSVLEDLAHSSSSLLKGKITHTLKLDSPTDNLKEQFLYLYQP